MSLRNFIIAGLLLCVIAFGYIVRSADGERILGWAAALVAFTVVLLISLKRPEVGRILLLAFLVRIAALLVGEYFITLPDSAGDANRFDRIAAEWASRGGPDLLELFRRSGSKLYVAIIAWFYSNIGVSRMMMQVINVFIGTLTVWEVFKLAGNLWGHKVAKRVGYLAAVFPTLILYSVVMLREPLFAFPLVIGVRYLITWVETRRPAHLFGSMFALIAASSFHPAAVPVLALAAALAILNWGEAKTQGGAAQSALRWVVGAGFVTATLAFVLTTGWGIEKLDTTEDLSLEFIAASQDASARNRAAYLPDLQYSTPLDAIWQTPIRMLFFAFSPFPWQVREVIDLVGVLDSGLYFALIVGIYRKRKFVLANARGRAALASAAAVLLILSMFTSNYGTAIRHRAKLAPLVIVIAGIAYAPRERSVSVTAMYAPRDPIVTT